MGETKKRSAARHEKQSFLWTAKYTPRPFIQTPLGRRLAGDWLKPRRMKRAMKSDLSHE
jgi:hypothetical protein